MKRINRVTKNTEFHDIIEKGIRIPSKQFNVFSSKNNLQYSRFGISVSKKRGNAVVRNKIKRQIRSMIQTNLDTIKKGYDFVVIVKDGYLEQGFKDNEKVLLDLLLVK